MDASQIRKVAEKVQRTATLGFKEYEDEYGNAQMALYDHDAELLADVYLQANPADDDEPLTPEWLSSVMYKIGPWAWRASCNHSGTKLQVTLLPGAVSSFCASDHDGHFCFLYLKKPHTRRTVRSLCEGLQLKLKEPTDG